MLTNVNRMKSLPVSTENMAKEFSAPTNQKAGNGENIGAF